MDGWKHDKIQANQTHTQRQWQREDNIVENAKNDDVLVLKCLQQQCATLNTASCAFVPMGEAIALAKVEVQTGSTSHGQAEGIKEDRADNAEKPFQKSTN